MSRRRALPSGNNVVKAIGFLPEERGQSAPQILSVPYEPHGPAVLAAPALPDPPGWKAGRSQLCLSGSAERSAQLLHPAGFVPGFVQGFIQGRPPGIPPGIVQDIPSSIPVTCQWHSSDIPVTFPVSPGRDGKGRKRLLSMDKTVTKSAARKQTARRSVCQGLNAFPYEASNP